jgi:cellulose synthase/poly-beta-1,6-N-acetylglucosamine synthase-like glycosyltransferase
LYNEEPLLFEKTMKKVHENLKAFKKQGVSPDKIAVAVVIDGIDPFTKGMEENKAEKYYKPLFNIKKIYSYFNLDHKKDQLKEHEKRTEVTEADMKKALLNIKFEMPKQKALDALKKSQHQKKNTKQRALEINFDQAMKFENIRTRYYEFAHLFIRNIKFDEDSEDYLRVYFCVKQYNKRKLNSHLWFFGGLCQMVQPRYCMLIDVGTEPEPESLWLLYRAMEKDQQVAGVCGEIIPRNDNESIFNILSHAQKVEYKFSHIMDKALESVLGYISVLPGAFSCYRLEALQINEPYGPLWADYFKAFRKPWIMNCYNSNIYLAEDRVLCLSLVSCENRQNLLKYVRKAIAYTDPPPDYQTLLSQRRRWINGSWFALLDSVGNCMRIWRSGHNCCRKCVFTMQIMYYVLNIIYSFILVGGFYLALSICMRKTFDNMNGSNGNTGTALMVLYLCLLIITFTLSIGSNIKYANRAFWAISGLFSLYMAIFIVLLIDLFFQEWKQPEVLVPTAFTVFGFILMLCINNSIWTVAMGSLQFLAATPTYINTFTIYAICNIHDCTWGNRPEHMTEEERGKLDDFELFRTGWALLWVCVNSFFAYLMDAANQSSTAYTNYIYAVGLAGMSLIYLRFLGGFAHFIKQKCCKYTCSKPVPKDDQA